LNLNKSAKSPMMKWENLPINEDENCRYHRITASENKIESEGKQILNQDGENNQVAPVENSSNKLVYQASHQKELDFTQIIPLANFDNGSFGNVSRWFDQGHFRYVTSKEVDQRNGFDETLILKHLDSLNDPSLLKVYRIELNLQKQMYNIFMEWGDGTLDTFARFKTLNNLNWTDDEINYLLNKLSKQFIQLERARICHRDIKPENIIVDYSQNTLKLTDFGSAKMFSKSSEGAVGGTLNYMAPEVLLNMRGGRNICDKAVDVWSIGILTYLLISGIHPFDSGKTHENILNRIISGKFEFSGPVWEKVSKECKDFIKRCLVVDPKKRATIGDLLKHPWVAKPGSQNVKGCFFSEEECERILKEKSSQSTSRSNSMGSLLELFSNEGVSRS